MIVPLPSLFSKEIDDAAAFALLCTFFVEEVRRLERCVLKSVERLNLAPIVYRGQGEPLDAIEYFESLAQTQWHVEITDSLLNHGVSAMACQLGEPRIHVPVRRIGLGVRE